MWINAGFECSLWKYFFFVWLTSQNVDFFYVKFMFCSWTNLKKKIIHLFFTINTFTIDLTPYLDQNGR